MISRFEQFSFTISNIYRSIQKIEREEMDRYGLKGVYAQYLVALKRFPQGLQQCFAKSAIWTKLQYPELLQKWYRKAW